MRILSDMISFASSAQWTGQRNKSARRTVRKVIRRFAQSFFTCALLMQGFAAATQAQSAALSPTNLAPSLKPALAPVTMKPVTLSFGSETVGKQTAAKAVTLTNNQTKNLTILSISTSLTDYGFSTTCPLSPSVLAGGGTCTISVFFAPTVPGARDTTLTVNTDSNVNPSVALHGTGIVPPSVSPTSLTFDSQIVGTSSAPQTVTLTNNLPTSLLISSITSSTGDFGISSECPISATSLAPGASCTASVIFTPKTSGNKTALLRFKDNAPNSPQTVTLSGTGVAASLVSIAVTPKPASVALGDALQFTATGTYSNGTTKNITGAVKWASSSPAVAKISGGLATSVSQGSTNITATAAGIAGSSLLTVFAPALVSISVIPSSASIPAGTTQQFLATGNYSNGSQQNLTTSANWTSSNPAFATVNTAGLATGVAAGTATISATVGSISGSAGLTISTPALVSISVTPTLPSIPVGSTQQFAATGRYTDGSTQSLTATSTWTSSASEVATVNAAGIATGTAMGTATISATVGSISGSTGITVTPPTLVSISVAPALPSIPVGTTQQFAATGTYSDGSIQTLTANSTWASSASEVATVNAAGLAAGVATGTATISATVGSVSGSTDITVTPPALVSISVTPAVSSIPAGTMQQFAATGTFSDGSTRSLTATSTWGSTNSGVASIDASGLANALNAGNTTITATSGTISGFTTLTVTAAQSILSRVPERMCLVEDETSLSAACTLPSVIPTGDGVVVFISSTIAQTLAASDLQDSQGNMYALLSGPVSGGYGSVYMAYSQLKTALMPGDAITLTVPAADSWGLSIYDIGPAQSSHADVGIAFQNPDANDGLPGSNNTATGVPGWWTGRTAATTGTSDMCMAAVGVGPGDSPGGTPAPITDFSTDGGFTKLDMTQFYAQTDPAYGGGGSLLTMYTEVSAGTSVQSHVIANNGVPNTAPSVLYCVEEGAGATTTVPWFTGNSCSGTTSCTIDNVAPGHMLVISMHTFEDLPANPMIVGDSQPETVIFDEINGAVGLGTWHIAAVTNAGSHTITVNDPADTYVLMNVTEIAGQAPVNPVEAIGQNSFNNSPMAFAELTTVNPNDLLYGWGRSFFGSDEGQGFTGIRVAPTAEYAVAPAPGPQTVLLDPRGSPPWAVTGVQGLAIRPYGSTPPNTNAPRFTGNYCVAYGGSCTIENVSAGNLLVISSWVNSNQSPTVTDIQSETIVLDRANDNDGANVYLSTWHIAGVANPGSHTISVDPAIKVVVTEYTDQSSTNPIDSVAAAVGTTGGSATVSLQTSQGNDLIYAWCGTDTFTGWGDGFAVISTSPTSEFRMAASAAGTETATCASSPDNPTAGWVVQELAIRH